MPPIFAHFGHWYFQIAFAVPSLILIVVVSRDSRRRRRRRDEAEARQPPSEPGPAPGD